MKRGEREGRKKYEPPAFKRIFVNQYSSEIPNAQMLCGRIPEPPSGPRANGEFRIVLDLDGRFQDISEEFFELTGYKREQLLGKRIDEFTAPRSADVSQHLGAVIHFGHFHCLWMFVVREGRAIVVRTDWMLLPNLSMELRCDLIPEYK